MIPTTRPTCPSCASPLVTVLGRGRPRRYCSSACKQRAYRVRSFPSSMLERKAWVRCVGKRPVMVDGSPASSTDPATWATFGEVQSGAGDGFGVMLGGGLGCYDLDHVDDAGAGAYIASIPEGVLFVERSVSGAGVHVFVKAPEGPGWKRDGVERYTRARFIRTTGVRFTSAG